MRPAVKFTGIFGVRWCVISHYLIIAVGDATSFSVVHSAILLVETSKPVVFTRSGTSFITSSINARLRIASPAVVLTSF